MEKARSMTTKASILELGNLRRVKKHLSGILDPPALEAIEREIERHVQGLYTLALAHHRFAKSQAPAQWRQKVSRLYYAAYNASKATRMYVNGDFSTETSDHKKVGELPNDFPQKPTYANQLSVLREDRNLSDYDHVSGVKDLTSTPREHAKVVEDFLQDVREYLKSKGIEVRGRS